MPGYQAVQSGHALVEFLMRYPQLAARWHLHSNHLVYLSVPDLPALEALLLRLRAVGLACAAFHEPDIGHALTAFAVEPSPLVRTYCGGLPLCLKEFQAPITHFPKHQIQSSHT